MPRNLNVCGMLKSVPFLLEKKKIILSLVAFANHSPSLPIRKEDFRTFQSRLPTAGSFDNRAIRGRDNGETLSIRPPRRRNETENGSVKMSPFPINLSRLNVAPRHPYVLRAGGGRGVETGQTDQSGGNKNQRTKKVRGHMTRWRRPRCPLFSIDIDRSRSFWRVVHAPHPLFLGNGKAEELRMLSTLSSTPAPFRTYSVLLFYPIVFVKWIR
ncbi:hypothetical protein CEXT_310331 [Caerostris extrusa]|uniref:Uncharacterized protein n=1 Tax=Caerostris extrusa TaxID=172846 RepID=A0AAV4WML0_CAEEX|nr:hypothetical protein CEXT_310331 [Caerostris extrusa]